MLSYSYHIHVAYIVLKNTYKLYMYAYGPYDTKLGG